MSKVDEPFLEDEIDQGTTNGHSSRNRTSEKRSLLTSISFKVFPTLIIGFLVNVLILNGIFSLHTGFHVIDEYESGVRLRLGKFDAIEEPGLNFALPFFDTVHILKTWEHVVPIPTQSVATKDLVTLSLDAVLRYKINDPREIVVAIDDADRAGTEVALAAIKEAVGEVTYEQLISERKDINERIRISVDEKVQAWGLTILGVEIKKSIPVDPEVQKALSRRAISVQEKAAREVISAAELSSANNLVAAAKVLHGSPGAGLTLRYFQTLDGFTKIQSGNFLIPLPLNASQLNNVPKTVNDTDESFGIIETIMGDGDSYEVTE
ncbi:MAG: SPFH domain-containing protein [Roseibium sp.]